MSATSVHISALDGIVNVNSLFTLAVFIGLTWNPTDPSNSLIDPSGCSAGPRIAEDLVAFHVYSFSCFLFSSLVALGIKQAARLARGAHQQDHRHFWAFDLAHVNKTALRLGYVVSAVGSVTGSVFLMLALVNVVQIKLGVLGCGTGAGHAYAAVVPLVTFVPAGLLIYVCFVFYAFTR
ncbi:uncharacterized protein LOC131021094 [Salvia miltiorrhiza]|uniref:uncharacterized protein LOC131021094 n=1 Tax=Salvia miltiorrhiza TaxID=226208 RepID=UPI0025ACAD10|nr:uncharacterized protein LOC131021094 [Salvia miltiorrhiza]